MSVQAQLRVPEIAYLEAWDAIHRTDVPLLLIEHVPPQVNVEAMFADGPFVEHVSGSPPEIAETLGARDRALAADAARVAARFTALMGVVRIDARLEAITDDHCRKFHADYVDVRLIACIAGRGTEFLHGESGVASCVPTGWIGLFKGRAYGEGHLPCLHRSPPIAGTGERRLLLVMDTPQLHREAG